MALTFSSTIIVVKLLSDRREIDELHGRIAVGILIVQDLVVIGAIIALTAIGADTDGGVAEHVAWVVGKGVALLAGVALITRYALTALVHRAARTPELLVLGAIAWAVGLAALADALGFSSEVGAFLAGVALASTRTARPSVGGWCRCVTSCCCFFFLDLGADLDIASLGGQLLTALVLSAFVLVAKPLIVVAVTSRLGYTSRVGFLAGVSMRQISEFSLILAALGLGLGHLHADGVALITAIALITISLSTYATLYGHELYERLRRPLALLERHGGPPLHDEADVGGEPIDVIVLGGGRFGGALLGLLRDAGHRTLVVDFDPRVVEAARAEGHLGRVRRRGGSRAAGGAPARGGALDGKHRSPARSRPRSAARARAPRLHRRRRAQRSSRRGRRGSPSVRRAPRAASLRGGRRRCGRSTHGHARSDTRRRNGRTPRDVTGAGHSAMDRRTHLTGWGRS